MARPLRVVIDAHTVGRQQTGNERYVVELARALARRDDVEIIAYVDSGAEWPRDSAAPSIHHLRFRQAQLRIPIELPVRARRDRADVLHVSYVAPPVAGLPIVTTVHDLSFEDMPEAMPLRTRLRLKVSVRAAVHTSAAVICGSEFTRDRLVAVYGLPPERVHLTPYGIAPIWRPLSGLDCAVRLRPYDLPARFVLAAGTSQPRKNLPRLIEAVARLRDEGLSDLGLVICGPGGRKGDPVDRATARAHAAGWVHRVGYVSDDVLRALYSTAAVVACVSLYEGFGLPVLEALACEAAVVASRTTALTEAADEACVLVDPADLGSIAEGLRTALNDRHLRERLRARAADHVRAFTWERCAEQTVAVYRAVVG